MKAHKSIISLNAVASAIAGSSMELRNGEDTLNVFLKTSGTVSMTVDVEALNPGTTDWHRIGTSGAITTAANQPVIVVPNVCAQEVRLRVSSWTNGTVTGTILAGRIG